MTLAGVSHSSLAYIAVTMLSAVFDDRYGTEAMAAIGPSRVGPKAASSDPWAAEILGTT